MATHSSILAWRIPWTEEPGGLKSMGSQRVGHDRRDPAHTHAWHRSRTRPAKHTCTEYKGKATCNPPCWGQATAGRKLTCIWAQETTKDLRVGSIRDLDIS